MPKHALGIEFDPPHLTVVQLTGTAKAYSVTFAHHQALPHHGAPEEQAALQQQAVQELVTIHRLRPDVIVTTVPAQRVVLRNLEVPFKHARRIRPTLKFALEEHIPFEPDEVVMDFQMLALPGTEANRLLVAATPKEVMAEHLSLFQAGSVEPTIVDLDVFALANAALLGCDVLETNAVLIDVRPTRTLLTLLHRGTPVFARSLAHGGFTETPLPLSLDRLSKQLQHTLYACENALKQSYEPEVLLLSGAPGASLGSLATAFEKEVSLPTRVWQVTNEGYQPGKVPFPPEEQAQYAVAFGAAARGLHRQAVGINLRREGFELHRDIQELRGRLIGLGVMLVLVAGMGIFSLYLNNHFKAQRYTQLRSEITRVFTETFPGARLSQNAPGIATSQMRDKVKDFEKRLEAFGGATGAQLSGLRILREISARIPASVTVNVDNLTITTDTIDLSGTTASYDDVVKLKDALEASTVFPAVKINNTKSGTEGKIDFKLTITTAKTREPTS
jgi:Tfp pilus assembly PilM family ATPase/Tfp pilus assembly protein PilN